MRVLPHHAVSLLHYVELTSAGWWDDALERFVLAHLWLLKEPAHIQQIRKGVLRNLSLDVKMQELNATISRLTASKDIIPLGDGRFRLSEPAEQRLSNHAQSANALEQSVREEFCQAVAVVCPQLDPATTWQAMIEKFLVPFVMSEGARTYNYVIGGRKIDPWMSYAEQFLDQVLPACREKMRQLTYAFFSRDDPSLTQFLLSYLDAYFLLSACGLPSSALRRLADISREGISFAIFVDTNFVFSIMGLHDNPSNEAANDLMELVRSATDHLSVDFFIAQHTLDETRQSIKYHRERLSATTYPPNLAEAALGSGIEISGVYRTFFERVKASGRNISVDDYFAPYENNLAQILKERAVSTHFEKDSRKYVQTLDVIEDIESQEEYEKEKYDQDAKTEQQITHDIVLWHLVRDQREPSVSSPLMAKYWIVTVDYRFLAFDRYKTGAGSAPPVCMHPSQLIQMLRFFVPRTPQFEKTLLGIMRLPIMGRDFDSEAEQICIRILNHLARHEGIEDLHVDTITHVLTDMALRARLKSVTNEEEEFAAINDALAQRLREHEKLLEKQEQEIAGLREHLTKLDERMQTQTALSEQSEAARLSAEQQIKAFGDALSKAERERDRYRVLLRALVGAIVVVIGVGAILLLPDLLSWQWLVNHPKRLGLQIAAIAIMIGIVWATMDTDKQRRGMAFISVVVGTAIALIQII